MFLLDWSTKRQNLKFQMGLTGAPFGRTELLVPPLEPQERDLARGKGPRGLGRWEKVEKCFIFGSFLFFDIFGPFCLTFFQVFKKNETS